MHIKSDSELVEPVISNANGDMHSELALVLPSDHQLLDIQDPW